MLDDPSWVSLYLNRRQGVDENHVEESQSLLLPRPPNVSEVHSGWLYSLHPGRESSLRPQRGLRHDTRRRATHSLRTAQNMRGVGLQRNGGDGTRAVRGEGIPIPHSCCCKQPYGDG